MSYLFFILFIFSTSAFAEKPIALKKFIGKTTGVNLTRSHPIDINAKNYPDIIESFVFPNAELKDVIKAMSTDLNINIIMDPSLSSKKISIISYSPITVAEAYQAFLSALAIHNLTVIRSGSFLKVVTTDKALQSNSYIYKGNDPINTDQFLTSIIKLKYIDAAYLEKKIKPFIDSKSVKSLIFYPPSNTVIISDYGLNVDKLRKIINFLDVPSQDIIFKVFPIKHAMAAVMEKTITKLLLNRGRSSYMSWNRSNLGKTSQGSSAGIQIRSLSSDERTNSIIAMGNQGGINKIRELIEQLDYYKDPELAGGIYVYQVMHGIASEIAGTLNQLMNSSSSSHKSNAGKSILTSRSSSRTRGGGSNRYTKTPNLHNISTAQSFQDVRIIAESNTNSLLIVSNKYNYQTLLGILKKIDISRNQVFVKSVIMELSTDKTNEWQIANYFFKEGSGGISRMGYGLSNLSDLASSTRGATLLFPLSLFFQKTILGISPNAQTDIGNLVRANGIKLPGALTVPSLSSFIKFLQKTVGANILSTPQIMALDHQEARVSITEKIPVIGERTSQANINQFVTSTSQVDVETALIITPHINPDVNSIRLKIEQKIDNIVKDSSVPEELQKTNVAIKKRIISTFITLKDRETAVLGGLVKETNSTINSKIPILGDLPFIGWLFKNSNIEKKKSNLIVFITPHIIHSAEEHKTILGSKLKERMNFIQRFTGTKDPYQDITQKMLESSKDISVSHKKEKLQEESQAKTQEENPEEAEAEEAGEVEAGESPEAEAEESQGENSEKTLEETQAKSPEENPEEEGEAQKEDYNYDEEIIDIKDIEEIKDTKVNKYIFGSDLINFKDPTTQPTEKISY